MTSKWPFAVAALAVLMLVSGCDENHENGIEPGQNKRAVASEKEKQESDAKKRETKANREKIASAAKYHRKNLKDKDPLVRENSAEMLGLFAAPGAVPDLIEALGDKVLMVQLKAHAALIKITGKNFDYRGQKQWRAWWKKESEEFLKKGGPNLKYRMKTCGYRVES